MSTLPATRFVVLGRVLGAHGLDGRLRLESYTSPGVHLAQYNPWWLRLGTRWIRAWPRLLHPDGHGRFLVHLAGLEGRGRAHALAGCQVGVPRERLPEPGAGSYYWCDLIGLAVYEEGSNLYLGRVSALLHNGAHEVLELEGGELLPFLPGVNVGAVDLAGGCVHIRRAEELQ